MARKAVTYMEASSGNVDSSLFKSWSPGVGLGPEGGMEFYIGIYIEKIFKNLLLKNYLAREAVTYMEA